MPSWENSLEHITRGYSGPGNAGGVCSSVAYVMLGAPSILIVCYNMYSSLSWVFKKLL